MVYVGSTDPRNFGEDNEKGVTIIYNDGSHEFVNLQFKPFVTVDLIGEDLTSELLSKVQAKAAEAHVRLRVEGTISEQFKTSLDTLGNTVKVELHREVIVGDVQQVTRKVIVTNSDLVELYRACGEDRQWTDIEVGLKLLEEAL